MSLSKIQTSLVAQKNQYNNFGKYKYRSLEDITDALKPHLSEFNYSLVISDTIEEIGGRIYVKSSAKLHDETMKVVAENVAYAREPISIKGMSDMQITGATSSYARKYALNGLFAIDDNKDADSQGNSNPQPMATEKQVLTITQLLSNLDIDVLAFLDYFHVKTVSELTQVNADKAIAVLNKKVK